MSSLDVKISADVTDLQVKFATAKAEVNALAAEMRKLAQESAKGVLDPAGQAQLQQVAEDFLRAKSGAKELSDQMRELHETGGGVGEALDEIRGKISTAFEISGIAAAYEAIKRVGEVIEQLGARATQMRAMADVLGITVEQFQTMSVAAEEGGVSVEVFARATERLIALLTEARGGSSAAEQKLFDLGVTTKEINDPTFKLNDLLGVLRERLENSATSQSTMNELIKDFGPRAALAAEAIKEYDGSQASVAETMQKLHGLNEGQVSDLHQMHAAWNEMVTTVENLSSKALVAAGQMGQWLAAHSATLRAISAAAGASTPGAPPPNVGVIDRSQQQAAQQAAQAQEALQREMSEQELENVKAGVEAYKEGTAQRLAALRQYADLAQQYYGSSEVDVVKKANEAVISETRRYNEERKRQLQELSDYAQNLDTRAVTEHGKVLQELNALNLKQSSDQQRQLEELSNYAQELDTRVTREHARVMQELARNTQEQTRTMMQQWQFLTNGMRNGFDQALRGILTGTESVGQAMRDIFTSVLDGIIGKLSEWAAEWITKMLLAKFTNDATATSQVIANAGVAATAAMASVAAIPFVGWALAPEVGSATYAEALAIGLPKAESGWDIPKGINPVAQLHSGEMVLPQGIADVVRNAASQGTQSQAGGRSARLTVHHVQGLPNGHVLVHEGNLADALKKLGYQFKLT